ncbi:GTP-binding protein [Salana multivorans]
MRRLRTARGRGARDRRVVDAEVEAVLLALPLGAEILPATRQLAGEMEPGGRLFGARLGLAVTATSSPGLAEQLGDGDDDLVSQLVAADIVLLAGTEPTGRDLADALRSPFSTLVPDLCEPWVLEAIAGQHDVEDLTERCDPVTGGPGHGFVCVDSADGVDIAASGVWRIELASERPFHPERLLALMAHLAPDTTTSRGVFWLANRPDTACGWEATGGTVLVGVAGPWEEAEPVTRLDVIGHGDAGRAPWRHVRRAFERALVTDEELADPASWLGRTDPLALYLGDPADLYRT